MGFSEMLQLDEMMVHKVSQRPDTVVAYRQHLWLLDRDTPENYVRNIAWTVREEHPQGKNLPERQVDTTDDLGEWLRDYVVDAFVGQWDPVKRTLWTGQEFGMNPVTSPLIRKVAQALNARNMSYSASSYIQGKYDEKDVKYKRSQMLGAMPDEMFHGTTTKYLPMILRFGLRPGQSESNWDRITYDEDIVFLTSRFDNAEFHAAETARKKKGYPVVFKFVVPDKSKFVPDYDADVTASGRQTYYHDKNEMDHAARSSVDAMKTSMRVGVVAYRGRIPASFITAVYLHIGEKWKSVRLDTLKKRVEDDPWEWQYKYGFFD